MNLSGAIISGIVQGLTEFFPISSSGHLVILQAVLGIKEPQMAFDIFLHLGTLLSVLIFFRNDIIYILTNDRKLLGLLVLASVPAAIVGVLFKDSIESIFSSPRLVGFSLILTGIWLAITSLYINKKKKTNPGRKPGLLNSILVGISQGIAVIPGISRSGATICTGILAGMDSQVAVKFSFLLSVPAIMGAVLLKSRDIGNSLATNELIPFLAGGLTAMIIGIISIKVLLKIVRNNALVIFAAYCIAVGAGSVILLR